MRLICWRRNNDDQNLPGFWNPHKTITTNTSPRPKRDGDHVKVVLRPRPQLFLREALMPSEK